MTPAQFAFCAQSAADYTDPDAYVSDIATSYIWGDAQGTPLPEDRISELRTVYAAATRSVRDIVDATGQSQAAFARKHCIPIRTVNNWCLSPDSPEHRDCPLYIRLLLQQVEGLLPG